MPLLLNDFDDKHPSKLWFRNTWLQIITDNADYFGGRDFSTVVECELPDRKDGVSERRRADAAAHPCRPKK